MPKGLFDPVSCKNSRCRVTRVVMMKGRIK